jgi:hypothetical protein
MFLTCAVLSFGGPSVVFGQGMQQNIALMQMSGKWDGMMYRSAERYNTTSGTEQPQGIMGTDRKCYSTWP